MKIFWSDIFISIWSLSPDNPGLNLTLERQSYRELKLDHKPHLNRVDILIGQSLFTSYLYSDSLKNRSSIRLWPMEIFRCGGSARERCLVDVRDSGTDRRGDSIQISDILACERIGSFFAANPLGKHDLSGGEDTLNFTLAAGSPATFRHRIIIYTGESIAIEEIKQDWATFSKRK